MFKITRAQPRRRISQPKSRSTKLGWAKRYILLNYDKLEWIKCNTDYYADWYGYIKQIEKERTDLQQSWHYCQFYSKIANLTISNCKGFRTSSKGFQVAYCLHMYEKSMVHLVPEMLPFLLPCVDLIQPLAELVLSYDLAI